MEELPRPRSYRVLLRWSGRDCALLLPAGVSGELLFEAQAVPVPGAPEWFAGLIAVRGEVVPVLRLADPWVGTPDEDGHLLVVRSGSDSFALQTQALAGFAALGDSLPPDPADVPPALADSCGARWSLEGDCPRGIDWFPLRWSQSLQQLHPTSDDISGGSA